MRWASLRASRSCWFSLRSLKTSKSRLDALVCSSSRVRLRRPTPGFMKASSGPCAWHTPMTSFAMPTTALPSTSSCRSTMVATATARSSAIMSLSTSAERSFCTACARFPASCMTAARRARPSTQKSKKVAPSTKASPAASCTPLRSGSSVPWGGSLFHSASMRRPGSRGPNAYPRMFLSVISVPDAKVRSSPGTTSMLMPQSAATAALRTARTMKMDAQIIQSHTSPAWPRIVSTSSCLCVWSLP
mmetsp:Transcript_30205/g.85174  ORF Transcript_30205/g.85174 Transcript_30205/m.85174 type:complete len:246 (+) Transcript_30205:264-1001(+)